MAVTALIAVELGKDGVKLADAKVVRRKATLIGFGSDTLFLTLFHLCAARLVSPTASVIGKPAVCHRIAIPEAGDDCRSESLDSFFGGQPVGCDVVFGVLVSR